MKERKRYSEDLTNQANDLMLKFNQSYQQSRQIPLSELTELFDCAAFEDWKKQRENKFKFEGALLEHIGSVAKAIYRTARSRR